MASIRLLSALCAALILAACAPEGASAQTANPESGWGEELDGMGQALVSLFNREAARTESRLRVNFRPARSGPQGVDIYCEALSHGLRNALAERVEALSARLSLATFDVAVADERAVAPPDVTISWSWDGAGSVRVEAHVLLAGMRSARVPAAALDAAGLNGPERACLFSFLPGVAWVEAGEAGELVEEPSFRADAWVADYEAGARLRVLGRLEAADGSGGVWWVVAWRDPETRERRNLFAMGLADGVDDVPPPDPDPPYVVAEKSLGLSREDRVLVQRGLESAGGSVGPADGIFGPLTRAALWAWQEKRGLTSTGYLMRDQADALVALGRDAPPPPPPPEPDPVLKVGDVFRDCADCPAMVVVPSGSFMMGSPPSEEGRRDNEGPVHRVSIPSAFAVGVYEVTRGEFGRFVSSTGRSMGDGCWYWENEWKKDSGRSWRSPGFSQTDLHPAVCVSWDEARAYVAWLSRETGEAYRLLSESEWEYVARAGTRTRYHWGDAIGRNLANCGSCGSRWDGESTSPVGVFGANGFSLHDVHGNVYEWVEDCMNESYAGAPRDGSAWKGGDCSLHVLRDGSWNSDPRILRAANRDRNGSGYRGNFNGFRVARTFTP